MRFLKLTLAYDGTAYVGWQVQSNGLAIQEVLEQAWTSITQEKIRITASGRTDSGVHAIAQVCSLQTNTSINNQRLVLALNAQLPFDIRVLKVEDAPVNFHAIRDAVRKTYRYQLQTGSVHDVFDRQYRWFIPRRLDRQAMSEAAAYLVGKHDFSSFEAAGAAREHSIRHVTRLAVLPRIHRDYEFVDIEITADGFLYNMVRNIVGTLVVIGRGRQPAQWIQQVLAAKDRSVAGETAPAHGLFMVSVQYDLEFSG